MYIIDRNIQNAKQNLPDCLGQLVEQEETPTTNTKTGKKPPCYYQEHTKNEETFNKLNRSHSRSKASYRKWAFREMRILQEQNTINPPTHNMTIKQKTAITKETLSSFYELFRRKIEYQSKKLKLEIAGYEKTEIERNNLFHSHILLRTIATRDLFEQAVRKINKAIGTQAEITYFEPIQDVDKAVNYSSKYGKEREVLLFKPEDRMRIVRWFGGYFSISRNELWDRAVKKIDAYNKKTNRRYFNHAQRKEIIASILKDLELNNLREWINILRAFNPDFDMRRAKRHIQAIIHRAATKKRKSKSFMLVA